MTTIYFVRHGQASFGAESYDKLSAKGELQAQFLGQYLAEILKQPPYVVAGSMLRHQQTAKYALAECFPEVDIHTNAKWNEFNHEQVFARYEAEIKDDLHQYRAHKLDNPRAYLAQIFKGAIARWTSGDYEQDYTESWLAFRQRVQQALNDLYAEIAVQQPRYVVVFTSGGVISVVVGLLLGLSASKTFELNWSVVNTSLTTVRIGDDQAAQLVSFNEHHFIKANQPELLTWI